MTVRAVAALVLSGFFVACAAPAMEGSEERASTETHQEAADAFEGADVLVIAGQSNAVGQNSGAYGDDAALTNQDAKIFQIGRRGDADRTVIPARDPLHFRAIEADWTGGSFAMPLARRYAKSVLASGRRLVLVPAAQGATTIKAWDPADAASIYQDMKARTALALAQPGRNRLVGVIWQQGESDVMGAAAGGGGYDMATYGASLKALAGALRTDFAEEGCFPFLVGEMSREWTEWPTLTTEAIVREKAAFNASVMQAMPFIPCSSFVPSLGLHGNAGDKVHFDAPSQTIFADRYASILGAGNSRAKREALLSTVYTGLYGGAPPPAVLATWTENYNPAGGVGCRAIVQAFLLANPLRAQGEADIAALPTYVRTLYRALLPDYPGDQTTTIVGWRSDGLVTMNQLDGVFLDNPMFIDRCATSGVAF